MHIVMTWKGPQSSMMQPPSQLFTTADLQQIPVVLSDYDIKKANTVKLVPSALGALLQVSNDHQSRRYFQLNTQQELINYDQQQARWLANYYVNDSTRKIASVNLQTEFDDDYPWVNRLLPVYKVVYQGEDKLTVYVHTESLMLSMISNAWEQKVQWVFRQVHTWQWLDGLPFARILLMMLLLSSLLATTVVGLLLLILVRRKATFTTKRFWHRCMAYVVVLPLLGSSSSGIYHLLYSEFFVQPHNTNLAEELNFSSRDWIMPNDMKLVAGPLQSIALLSIDGKLWYRASLAHTPTIMAGPHAEHDIRQKRFDGVAKEVGGLYFPAEKNVLLKSIRDEDIAKQLAIKLSGADVAAVESVNTVTHFGMDYDFRNKRLPVWRVVLKPPMSEVLFIDVASGILVDRVNASAAKEGLAFSFLHKWNYLTFIMSREWRDIVMVTVLSLALILAVLGVFLRRPTKKL